MQVLTADTAVIWALRNNPELAALRQEHGIAAAGIVIARTYPFNPFCEAKIRAATGPESAGISNSVGNEVVVLTEVEIRGQGRIRRQGADAVLSRTDLEIATQEVSLAIRTARAFDTLLYRAAKQRQVEKVIRENKKAADQVRALFQQGKLKSADEILARTEVDDASSQLAPANAALAAARPGFATPSGHGKPGHGDQGGFSCPLTLAPLPQGEGLGVRDAAILAQWALSRRPDLKVRQQAVVEADARLRLERANRYGNPVIGPAYEYDYSRASNIGVQIGLPMPVFNTHRGEILQRDAELTQATLFLHQGEVNVRQDVQTALARLEPALASVNVYKTQVVPNLEKALKDMEQLFSRGDPSVDVLRLIDVRRKLLKAEDGYLDAVWEATQAKADVAAAVGDPTLELQQ